MKNIGKSLEFISICRMKHQLVTKQHIIAWYQDGPPDDVPLLLLHGFCEDASVWDDLVLRKPHLPILRMDLPGFGESQVPAAGTMDAYAEAVAAALDAADVHTCVLAGHSMGGYTGLAFARRFPERLAGLCLVHSHPYADTPERVDARRRGIELLKSGKKDLYVAQLFPGLFEPKFGDSHPDLLADLIKKGQQGPAEGIICALEAMMNRDDHSETLRDLQCPAAFLLGSADMLVPQDQGLKAAVLPAISKVHLMPGVAHMGMFEAPAETADMLETFYGYCIGRLSNTNQA
ncbi:MAG: alpha/beta hydrolase [Bacteroidota bacterium]